MKNQNFLLSNYRLLGSSMQPTPEIELQPGAVVDFDVMVEGVFGTPSSASLAVKFQIAPIEYNGYNMNWDQVGGVDRPWIDVVAADGFTGHLLLDGAWPASLADQTLTSHRIVHRRLRVPAVGCLVRVALTPTFAGGTAPSFRVTVVAASDE